MCVGCACTEVRKVYYKSCSITSSLVPLRWGLSVIPELGSQPTSPRDPPVSTLRNAEACEVCDAVFDMRAVV